MAVKLLWFHLMPYTELPDDFREKHPSVWVDVHSSLFDPKRAHLMYNDFMDELEFAAECGFDGVCVNEHHSNGYGLMPSPNLIASALARRTTDTAICVMGNSLALYNPPTRVAEEFAMIDCISGGRLIAGFPVGTPMDTCYAYGQNPSVLRERYHEAHDLVMRAWTERETFAFNGRFNQQRYVNIWPRPVQRPHPPVWIPGGGSVETWQWCAAMDYVYCYLSYFGYKAGRATMDGFWNEMSRLGKDRNPYRAGFLQFVGVAESRTEALERYAEAAEYFYGRCLHVGANFANPPGYVSEATQRAGIESQVQRAAALPGQVPDAGAADGRHRGARLCHRRLARRGRGATARGRPQPQCRAPHAAAAVRQHGQGADPLQHQTVRRAGDAADERSVRRPRGPVVAAPDGGCGARAARAVPPADDCRGLTAMAHR
jgi:alkanesulfonate monooxygenase SsuD/methylene tetrahydromethanopterin reductase-like flavin-dependent oxidoreductase (luciferase family)